MHLLVTRPSEDAHDLEQVLTEHGHVALLEPLLRIEPLTDVALPDKAYQAVLVTSANGVRALAEMPEVKRLHHTPLLAVGQASAQAAETSGFARVEAAGGDLEALTHLVAQRCAPAAGPLLYVAGKVVSGDLKGLLEARGFEVDRAVLYEAVEAGQLSADTVARVEAGGVDGVLLYSPRTARIWMALCERAGIAEAARLTQHYCLAQSVADVLLGRTAWSGVSVRVAARPTQQALLEII